MFNIPENPFGKPGGSNGATIWERSQQTTLKEVLKELIQAYNQYGDKQQSAIFNLILDIKKQIEEATK